jgi:hypothetical protein
MAVSAARIIPDVIFVAILSIGGAYYFAVNLDIPSTVGSLAGLGPYGMLLISRWIASRIKHSGKRRESTPDSV